MLHSVIALGTVAATLGASTSVAASSPHGAQDVERTSFIVTLRPGTDAASTASAWRGRGAEISHVYSHALSGFAGRLGPDLARQVRGDGRVQRVERDGPVRATETQMSATWGLDRVDQHSRPLDSSYIYERTGSGVTAYVIDSGVRRSHVDFNGRVASGYTAVDDGLGTSDCNGHGTHVAGTVAGTTYGVAKAVTVVPVRVLDCDGWGTLSGVIAGVDWVTSHHAAGAPATANMSLGGGASSSLDAAVRNSISDGVVYTVAAGNDNIDACAESPARVPEALTVAASTSSDTRASYSNWGGCIDLFAPGSRIKSTYNSSDISAATLSGTSMAAPHVAGLAALYLSAVPSASPDAVSTAIVDGATADVVSDAASSPNRLAYSRLEPAAVGPAFTAAGPPTSGTAGSPYGPYTFTATGYPAPLFDVASGALPAGLRLDAATGVLSGTPSAAGSFTFMVRAANSVNPDAISSSITITVGSPFSPLSPARVWDSRVGPGPIGLVGAGETREISVTGTAGVPASGVTAVVLNVTAVGPSADTYITAWPTGETKPLASNLNVPPGDTRANLVTVKVGANGKISFSNSAGNANLIADVAGYYGATGSSFTSLSPSRVWDSRVGPGPIGLVGAGQTREISVTGTAGVPASGVTAVVLNVTAVGPSADTYITAWPTGETKPLASNLNVPPGDTRANLVTVKVGANGKISFSNSAGNANLIADVAGYYGATGSSFTSLSPSRVWDSRVGPGPIGLVGAGQTREISVTGTAGVPASGVTAVVLNVTAVGPSADTYITAWPTGETKPLASNLNVPPGDTRANLVTVKVGANGKISFSNSAGNANLIADVAGYYGATSTST